MDRHDQAVLTVSFSNRDFAVWVGDDLETLDNKNSRKCMKMELFQVHMP